jgi:hypothetical protein
MMIYLKKRRRKEKPALNFYFICFGLVLFGLLCLGLDLLCVAVELARYWMVESTVIDTVYTDFPGCLRFNAMRCALIAYCRYVLLGWG